MEKNIFLWTPRGPYFVRIVVISSQIVGSCLRSRFDQGDDLLGTSAIVFPNRIVRGAGSMTVAQMTLHHMQR